jgi:hypothetical protein
MIEFYCTGRRASFRAGEHLAGRRSRFKQCGAVSRIPSPTQAGDVALAPGPPVLLRAVSVATAKPVPSGAIRKKKRGPRSIDREACTAMATGAGLALVSMAVPMVGFVIEVFPTIVHEIGHTATAWMLGSPALPSFDLTFGGGVSHILDRLPLLIAASYGVLGYLVFHSRGDRATIVVLVLDVALYPAAVFSPLRGLLILAIGHGAELLIAGIFLYRALSGSRVPRNEERPLYAFLELYLVLAVARFAYGLITDPEHRMAYEDAKGGGHQMDFSRVAEEYLQPRLEVVVAAIVLACALPLLAAFLFHRHGRRRR